MYYWVLWASEFSSAACLGGKRVDGKVRIAAEHLAGAAAICASTGQCASRSTFGSRSRTLGTSD